MTFWPPVIALVFARPLLPRYQPRFTRGNRELEHSMRDSLEQSIRRAARDRLKRLGIQQTPENLEAEAQAFGRMIERLDSPEP